MTCNSFFRNLEPEAMPSPLAHTLAGALLTSGLMGRDRDPEKIFGLSWPGLLGAVAIFSLLPDLPTVVGLFTGDLAAFHNRQEHSLVAGLVVASALAWICSALTSTRGWHWFVLILTCYWLHVGMDFLTVGRGVMVLWPWSHERFGSPIRVFYGLHWSEGWMSWRHLWTVLTELALFGALAVLILWKRRLTRASTRP